MGAVRHAASGEKLTDLGDVVGIVANHVGGELADGDAAAFGVDSEALPLLRGERAKEVQIGFAEQPVESEGVLRISGGVVAQIGPEVLIESGEGSAAVFDHLAIAPGGGDFVFGEVGDDFSDRPLAGCGSAREPVGGDAGDEFGEDCGGLRLGNERVSALGLFADAGEVVGGVGHRFWPRLTVYESA